MKKWALIFSVLALSACGVENEEIEPGDDQIVILEQLTTSLHVIEDESHLVAEIAIKNVGPENVEVTFPSGQMIEIIVENEQGDIVYQYSDNKMFTQAVMMNSIPTNEELSWTESIEVENPKGIYTVTGEVLVTEVNGENVLVGEFRDMQEITID
ncbi:BsuPI-related putative proteinase inhibitor [Bacillus sp. FJAT-45350]|uniref:BsuPI-related putative proteinase inhibitor n=1 Tax=Bacillus sp. FJAT-45350 TaxID=2011014 RepID=UPI000BB76357|nr:BsuPI-related putative proteinase inhibitor [Bacillus sp. FJAT-45350]